MDISGSTQKWGKLLICQWKRIDNARSNGESEYGYNYEHLKIRCFNGGVCEMTTFHNISKVIGDCPVSEDGSANAEDCLGCEYYVSGDDDAIECKYYDEVN